MKNKEKKVIRESILSGLDTSFQKLIKEKKENNSELAFSNRGKVVKIKAKDL